MAKFEKDIECEYCGRKPATYVSVLRRWMCEKHYIEFCRSVFPSYGENLQNEQNKKEGK